MSAWLMPSSQASSESLTVPFSVTKFSSCLSISDPEPQPLRALVDGYPRP